MLVPGYLLSLTLSRLLIEVIFTISLRMNVKYLKVRVDFLCFPQCLVFLFISCFQLDAVLLIILVVYVSLSIFLPCDASNRLSYVLCNFHLVLMI